MASRFFESSFIKEMWFKKLSPTEKSVFWFMMHYCDHAGLCELDDATLNVFVGENVTMETVKVLPVMFLANGKIFNPYFIKSQYKCTVDKLNPSNQVHKSAINLLEEAGVQTAPQTAPPQGAKDKEEDKDKDICIKGSVRGELPELAALWNQHCGKLAKVQGSNKTRDGRIKERLKEEPDLAKWIAIITKIESSEFCNGTNDKGWRADFDWLLQPEVRLKVSEGKYDNRPKPTDWMAEAQYVCQALKHFGSGRPDEAKVWLGEERWKRLRAIGGLTAIGKMGDNDFTQKKIADLLKNAKDIT